MRTLWHIALHDLRLHLSEKSAIFFLALMPLGFVFFFSMINGGGGDARSVLVALPVVDEDQDFLSMALVEQLRGESFQVDVYTPAEADTCLTPYGPGGFIEGDLSTNVAEGEASPTTHFSCAAIWGG
jgi:hypothetical protein